MTSESMVAIVDDDDAARDSLSYLLTSAGLEVRAFAQAQPFLDACGRGGFDCAVIDWRLGDADGLVVRDAARRHRPGLPVILISGYADVDTAVKAVRTGAYDFFAKPFSPDCLVERVQEALQSAAASREAQRARTCLTDRFTRLSRRETQVLRLILQDKLSKQVALELNVSPKTVEFHRANIMRKLEVSSVVSLVKLCMRANWS